MNEGLTIEQLGDQLGVRRRTIERVIKKLKDQGVTLRRVKIAGVKQLLYPPETVEILRKEIAKDPSIERQSDPNLVAA